MTGLRSVVIAVGLGLMLGQLATTVIADDDMTARRQALEPFFRTHRPSGVGPFPALLFVSGCSGFAPSIAPQAYTRAAERWLSRGYVVVFVDYLAARHLANCRSSAMLTLVAAVACDGSGAEPHGARRWDCAAGTVPAGLRTVTAGHPHRS